MGKGFDVKGLKKLLKDIAEFGDEGAKAIAETTRGSAEYIASEAKQNARSVAFDQGTLAQNIAVFEVSQLNYKVFANASGNAPYSAYIEFGTGTKVKVPSELAEVASRFKGGGGGSFKDGLEAIKDWCKRKGIPQEAAYPIFVQIITKGIEPKPFLYPAFVEGRAQYIKDLESDLEYLTKGI